MELQLQAGRGLMGEHQLGKTLRLQARPDRGEEHRHQGVEPVPVRSCRRLARI